MEADRAVVRGQGERVCGREGGVCLREGAIGGRGQSSGGKEGAFAVEAGAFASNDGRVLRQRRRFCVGNGSFLFARTMSVCPSKERTCVREKRVHIRD